MRALAELRFGRFVFLILTLQAILLVSTLFGEWATWDEGTHLVSGFSYLKTGDYRLGLEHPPLGKMLCALPLLFLGVELPENDPAWHLKHDAALARPFLSHNRVPFDFVLMPARLVTVALTLAFGCWIAYWTRRRFGAAPALLALSLFALDPNLIAHGRYVTTDLIAAFLSFAALTLWIGFWEAPSERRLWAASLALGFALTGKYSTVFLLPVVLAMGAFRWRSARWPWDGRLVLRGLAIAAASFAFAVLVAYAPALRWGLVKPFELFFAGFFRILAQTTSGQPSYLLGQFSDRGWWYYFPVAFAVKTPAATLALLLAAGLLALGRRLDFALRSLAGAALLYFGLSMISSFNAGIRHLLPVYAPLFVVAAVLLDRVRPQQLVWAAVALLAIENFTIYPHYLAFFNRLSGGPEAGPRYLLDSNLDWGQDLKKLARFVKKRQLPYVCVTLFTNTSPKDYPFPFDGLPLTGDPEVWKQADCMVAVGATPLYGLHDKPERFAVLRARRPDAVIGHSIYVYDLRKGAAAP